MGLLESIPTHMDYHGQKLAEQIFQAVIVVFAAVGFVWGYYCEQFVQTIYILGAGFALSCVLTLPPWPIYRRNPVSWQKVVDKSETQETTSAKKSKRKERSK